jgi:hypothetical protein
MSGAYSLSPSLVAASTGLLVAYVGSAIFPSPYVFSTLTNLSYLFVAFQSEFAALADEHSAARLIGQLGGAPLILALMGGSSFAYHRFSVLGQPEHTLDIFFGWLLVSHVAYTTFCVALIGLLTRLLPDHLDDQGARWLRAGLSLLFLVGVTLLMSLYDTIYSNQLTFYLIVGPGAAVFGGICRFILVKEEGIVQWRAVRLAVVEVVVALTATLAAVLAQGELLGRKLSRANTPQAYDSFHGNWHFLLAAVTGFLYSRAADAARVIQETHTICVCRLPVLDQAALALLFVYSVAVIVLKETAVDIDSAIVGLGMLAALFTVHMLAVVCSDGGERGPKTLLARPGE